MANGDSNDEIRNDSDAADLAVQEMAMHDIEERIASYQNYNPDLYYSHSGSVGFAIPLILLVGLPVVVVLSAIYSYVVLYCPVVGYVNIVFTGAFLFAIAFVLNKLAAIGKCRSEKVLAIIGLVCGVVAVYASWVFFVSAYSNRVGAPISPIALITNPGIFWDYVKAINNNGWWAPSGIVQWILSGIESVLIIGGSAMAGLSAIDRDVFCEDCNRWTESTDKMYLQPTEDMLVIGVTDIHPEHFLKLDEASPTDYPRLDAEVLTCESCKNLQAIRFQLVHQQMDDGELKEVRSDIPNVLIQRG